MLTDLALNSVELLEQFLAKVPRRGHQRPVASQSSRPNDMSVRSIMNKLSEAEVIGDAKTVADLQRLLKNRRRIAVKLFQFCDNVRPAYYGEFDPLLPPLVTHSSLLPRQAPGRSHPQL